ncbi:hypothetical protein GCM10018785_46210 [Streptomyces longispororuber]|uniref:Uncharacterized protein n=1 Tax=Streptomyces longispororuber TaxID=68230 RepID=A0A918ZXE3_9ACTN|nr:hypothetical protein [Streptomyces longispororuber]GHE72772.1 hypothetical protein GCM10018785_46210 [Streptomyces longispororuber]
MAADASSLERRAEAAYLVYLEHLRTCPRCALGWRERCRGAFYLCRGVRDARQDVLWAELPPPRPRRRRW